MSSPTSTSAPSLPQFSVKMKISVSALPNNLRASRHHLCYVHKNELYTVDHSTTTLQQSDKTEPVRVCSSEKEVVTCYKYVDVGREQLLVVGHVGGTVSVYTEDGKKHLQTFQCQPPADASTASTILPTLAYNSKQQVLYVSSTQGTVLCYAYSSATSNFTFKQSISLQSSPPTTTTTLCTSDDLLIAGDKSGTLTFVDAKGSVVGRHKCSTIKHEGYDPVIEVVSNAQYTVAAYSTGHIRIFSTTTRTLMAEVTAHTKTIVGLCLHPTKPLVLAASEDTYVSGWLLSTVQQQLTIKNVVMQSMGTGLLTGVALANPDNGYNTVAVSVYDSRYMLSFNLSAID